MQPLKLIDYTVVLIYINAVSMTMVKLFIRDIELHSVENGVVCILDPLLKGSSLLCFKGPRKLLVLVLILTVLNTYAYSD